MKKIIYLISIILVFTACEESITSFQSKNFIKYFGSGIDSKGYDVVQIGDRYVFTGYDKIGSDYQTFVGLIDKNGNSIWVKSFGDEGVREEGRIVKKLSGNILVSGQLQKNGYTHSFLLKLDENGNELWSVEYGANNENLIINDLIITDNNIYLIGKRFVTNESNSEFYISKLNYDGELEWEKSYFSGGSYFIKGFTSNDYLNLVGILGSSKNVCFSQLLQSNGGPINFVEDVTNLNQLVADAINYNNSYYLLVNDNNSSRISCKVLLLDSGFIKISESDAIEDTEGNTFLLRKDGSILFAGNKVIGSKQVITFTKLDNIGSTLKTSTEYRTFSGNVSKIIETNDKGVVMIGTTSGYGTMVQLIKTDKDLFMLKQ